MPVLATLNSPSAVVCTGLLPEPERAAADAPPRVTLTADSGEEFLLTADLSQQGACIAILPGPTGLDAPPVDTVVTEYAGMDGGWLVKRRAASRRITLPLLLWAPRRPELVAMKRRLAAALGRGPCTLRVAEADGTARTLHVHYTGGMEGDEGTDAAGLTFIKYGIQLTAPDPYWYGADRTSTFRVHGAPHFLSYPAGSWAPLLSDTMDNPGAWSPPGLTRTDPDATTGIYTRFAAGTRSEGAAVPYDGTSLYRLTARVRHGQALTGGGAATFSVGLVGVDAGGAPVPGGDRLITADHRPLDDSPDWTEFTGYVRGWSAPGAGEGDDDGRPSQARPGTMPDGTVSVRPVIHADGAALDVDQLTLSRVTDAPGQEPHMTGFFPLRITPSVIGDEGLPVHVTSDVDAWPVWRITGPLGYQDTGQPVVPVRLKNLTTGQQLVLDYGIPAARTVVIDTRPGIKAIYLESESPDGSRGENLWPCVSGPATLWPLVPGDNTIALTAAGASEDSAVTLTYQPRHLGA